MVKEDIKLKIFKVAPNYGIFVSTDSFPISTNDIDLDLEKEGYEFGKFLFKKFSCWNFDKGIKRAYEEFVGGKQLSEKLEINGKKYQLISEEKNE